MSFMEVSTQVFGHALLSDTKHDLLSRVNYSGGYKRILSLEVVSQFCVTSML